ncbi:MAG: sortase [Oscillospiraceae bacterium]|nr:sortase [Oscillospiraceae bacterium]
MKKLTALFLALCMVLSMAVTAHALEYTFDEDEQSGYGTPTSIEVVYTADGGAQKNEDISKNAALIPPTFGSATSNTLNTGEYLTPNLAPKAMAGIGGLISGEAVVVFPPNMSGLSAESASADLSGGTSVSIPSSAGSTIIPGSAEVTVTVPEASSSGYTEVTDDMYYKNGYLGTLEIPVIGLTANIVEGTDAAALKRGVGHFEDTSIWDGNVGLAAHNRGSNSYFGKIHTLELGDHITLTTKLGTRTYEVTSVSKVSETDRSALAASQSNVITLYTCVQNESDFRWCVTASEIV